MSSLAEMAACIKASTLTDVNVAQLVWEKGRDNPNELWTSNVLKSLPIEVGTQTSFSWYLPHIEHAIFSSSCANLM